MGLRGPGARPKRKPKRKPVRQRRRARAGASRLERVRSFIESLPVTSGLLAGTTFKLQAWQREILAGIYRTDDSGRRIVRQALITMPRKQGKTGLTAALALAHLCGPEAEPRGQVYSAAADRAQAALIYAEMKAIVERVPALEKRIIIRDFNKQMEDTETGSIYAALSADAKTKHGFSSSFWIYDELAQAPNRELYDVLSSSTAARAEPLGIVISTQSGDPHSIMSELVDYGMKLRDGVMADPTFLPVIYTAPENADPWDEATWRACNPALGTFCSIEALRAAALQAQRVPAREPAFRLLHLNQRVSAEAHFIARADWLACEDRGYDPDALRGRRCRGGLDLSSTTDLTALVLIFGPTDGDPCYRVRAWAWLPGDDLAERAERDRAPYVEWRKNGWLEALPGRSINKVAVARRCAQIVAEYDLQELRYDRWRIEDFRRVCDDEGVSLPLVPHGQGFRDMGPAVDEFERLLVDHRIRHDGNPCFAWNAANAVFVRDAAGNRKIEKARSRGRVDLVVAAVMAAAPRLEPSAKPAPQFQFVAL